jgi:hypothetical protein
MTMTVSYRKDHWIRLNAEAAAVAGDLDAYAATLQPEGPTAAQLSQIAATARTYPAITEGAETFLMVGGEGTWLVLEVNLLTDDPQNPFDPDTDLAEVHPEKVDLGDGLSGYRVFSMQSGGVIDSESSPEESLVVRIDYFLHRESVTDGWIYAGLGLPDPMLAPVVVPMVDELLRGVELG